MNNIHPEILGECKAKVYKHHIWCNEPGIKLDAETSPILIQHARIDMTITVPILEQYLVQAKNPRLERWSNALAVLNRAIAEQRIYNVEMQDVVKWDLNHGIEAALEVLLEAFSPNYMKVKNRYIQNEREVVWNDVSSFCQFNQAKGRIARIKKQPVLLKDFPILNTYIAALQEIVTINDAIVSLKPFIIKGRKPAENSTPVDLTNTGTCAICMHTQKLTGGQKMVHHGFQISDGAGNYFGFRSGSCFGVSRKPYELSCEANEAYLVVLNNHLTEAKHRLKQLRSGKVTKLMTVKHEKVGYRWVDTPVEIKKGEEGFEQVLETAIARAESEVRSIEFAIEIQTGLVKNWTRKPLYDELHK